MTASGLLFHFDRLRAPFGVRRAEHAVPARGSTCALDADRRSAINKAELVDAVRVRLGVDRRYAREVVDVLLDTIMNAVAEGNSVPLPGLGVLQQVERPARTIRDPVTGKQRRVAATSTPRLRRIRGTSAPSKRASSFTFGSFGGS